MEQFLVILRGTPASGKSTIAKKFRNYAQKVVWVKVDNFKDFFAEDASIALEQVNGSAVATVSYLLDQGFSVVMEGVFQDIKAIDMTVSIAKDKNVPVVVYQIQCSLPVLQKRDKERPGVPEGIRKPLGDAVIAEIYQKLVDNPYPKALILDTETKTLDECVDRIKKDLLNLKV